MRSTLAFTILTAHAFAAGGPENALVVINADSWASTAVANAYIAERGIPQANIVYLKDTPSFEQISVADFREKILQPIIRTVEQRGIARQIDYILYSSDFPTAIDVTADMAGKQFPKVITQPASITGLTFFYQLTLTKNPGYLGTNTNFYFRQRAQTAPAAPWPDDEMKPYATATRTLQEFGARREQERLAREKEEAEAKAAGRVPFTETRDLTAELAALRTAIDTLLSLKTKHPTHTELHYNLACAHALAGQPDAAIEHLREAVANGWWDIAHAQRDPDLRTLHARADFKLLGARAQTVPFDLWPTSGFRSSVSWLPTGQPAAPEKGLRYLLSTTLAHTSGLGLSVPESIANLRRSIAADHTCPTGTIYFLENSDVRSTTREWGNARAVEKLRSIGIAASIQPGILPQNKPDIAGALIGTANFDWAKSGSTILPGAICEHLTSFGGMLNAPTDQTPLTAFLRAGAAAASGTVTEPYAVQAKFPTPFIHWHYAQGTTLAEAYYQSVAAPYQLLIVGDALCAPWKKRISPAAANLTAGATIKGPLTLTPTAQSPDGLTPALYELTLDGRRIAAAKPGDPLTFNTALAPDGPHQFALHVTATDPLATNGTLNIPITIQNRTAQLQLTAPTGEHPWDQPLELSATAPGATAITFLHNLRPLAQLKGPSGKTTIDPRILGQGKIRILAAAAYPDKKETWATAELTIIPPKPIPAPAPVAGQTLQPGPRITPTGQPATTTQQTTGDWLTKAGVPADGEYTLEAWFQADTEATHQFQIQGPQTLTLTINGTPIPTASTKHWHYIPIPLAKGHHLLRIQAKAEGPPRLDIRFGQTGTHPITPATFRHAQSQ